MKKALLFAAALALLAWPAAAQTSFPPTGGTTTGSVSCDPAQWSDPAGTGSFGGSTGACTYSVDRGVVPGYVQDTASPGATCSPGEFYFETDLSLHICKATDTWAQLFTFVDDSIMLGSGTSSAVKALPDCDDSGGNHLNYDTTTNAFSCGTSSSGGGGIAVNTIEVYEEFLTGTSTTGQVGANGLAVSLFSTGTASVNVIGTQNHPGLLRLNSHASNDNSGAEVSYQATAQSPFNAADVTGTQWTTDALVLFGSNSTAITSTALYVGWFEGNGTSVDSLASGIFARHDSDRSDTTFLWASCNSTTTGCQSNGDAANQTTIASTITPSGGNYYRFRMRRVNSGVGGNPTVYVRVNDETELTFCASGCDATLKSPNNGLTFGVLYITRTTTGVMSADVDYLYLKMPITAARY